MSLVVWLPLNGDLRNLGASDIEVTNNGATVDNNGKIGKCIKITEQKELSYTPNFNTNSYSFSGWFKFNKSEINTALQTKTYSSTATSATGNLIGNTSYGGLGLVWTSNNMYSSNKTFSSMSIFSTLRTATVNQSTSSFTVDFDTWTHIIFSWNYLNRTLSLYKNGVLINQKTVGTFSDGVARSLKINYQAIYGGNGPSAAIPFRLNDVRIYNHCLSAAEVHEIAQGLVLHYKLDGGLFGNPNLLAKYVVPGQAAPTSTANGGRTTWLGDYKITIPATENADTYFRLFMTEQLISGTTYTISCKVSGLLDGSYYRFPLFAQSNTSMGVLNLDHNGLCSLTFTMNWTGTQTAATGANGETVYVNFLDDSSRSLISGQGPITLYDFKLEKGDTVTTWCPADSELTIDRTIVSDSSGYGHNGTINGTLTTSTNTSRYNNSCIFNGTDNAIQIPFNDIIKDKNYTISVWTYKTVIGTKSYQTILGGPGGFELEARSSSSTSPLYRIHNWGGGTTPYDLNKWNLFTFVHSDNDSKLYVNGELKITGTSVNIPTGNYYIGAWNTATQQNYEGQMSDFRIYCTPLLDTDIKLLYNIGIRVDNLGGVHTFEFDENSSSSLKKQGILTNSHFSENGYQEILQYDKNIYTEPDGSTWIHIFHHNNPANGLFSSSTNWKQGIYLDSNRWYDIEKIIPNLIQYEFMVKQKTTSDAVETKYRWIQNTNPLNAVYADVKPGTCTYNTTSGYSSSSYGGLYILNSNTHFCVANSSNGNWYGALGCWTTYSGGIPGYPNTAITSGYIDLYARVYLPAKIIKNLGISATEFIEI